ncbi:MAG: hypothetical protein COA57_09000 [Flavobacteriales bacterium]|nr:MAG: hypothetical protein COA57_09000 [Flavobacteriales bacterium]
MNFELLYKSVQPTLVKFKDASIALRKYGTDGPNIILIHGFPTHGYTWRKILPELSQNYSCYVIDLPGLGDSLWNDNTNFNCEAQADRVIELIKELNIDDYSFIAHNSGATVARIVALKQPKKVRKLILINTEIPNHRPPWIPLYQAIGLFPLVPFFIRQALKYKWFIRSPMGFQQLYSNISLLDIPENIEPYVRPIINSQMKTIGAFKYLKGLDWKKIDEFESTHRNIEAETLLLWGENDKTFPLHLAEKMLEQFNNNCKLIKLENASLLPHEEKYEEVNRCINDFLNN